MTTDPLPNDTSPAEDDHATAALVEELAEANARSNQTLVDLMAKVQQDAYMREKKVDLLDEGLHQTRKLLAMVGIALVLLLGLAAANFISINQTRKSAAITADTNKLLYGCFDSRSECSRVNQAQQTRLLDEIKKYELTALYCARINPQIADPHGEAFITCLKELYPSGPTLNRPEGAK